MSYPLTADAGGIKVRPERMERERLYHCVAGDKVMLVYRDNQDVLHCYEVEESELVKRVRGCPDRGMVDGILAGYAAEIGMGDGAYINKSAGDAGNEEPLSSDKKPTDAEEILSEFRAGGGQGPELESEEAAGGSPAQGQDERPAAEGPAEFPGAGDLAFMPPNAEQGQAAAEAEPERPAAAAEPEPEPERPASAEPEPEPERPAAASAEPEPERPAAASAEPEPEPERPAAASAEPEQPAPTEEPPAETATAPPDAGEPQAAQEKPAEGAEAQPAVGQEEGAGDAKPERNNIVFIGQKSTMDYVQATLTRLSNYHFVTITARGKRITLAVDVSQMIVKRMNKVGYEISEVRIGSDTMESEDGKIRNVSTIEIDIVDGMDPGQGGGGDGDAEQPAA